jgi:hypothetical protein
VEVRLERAARLFTATLQTGDPMRIHVGDQVHTLERDHAWHTCWDGPSALQTFESAA